MNKFVIGIVIVAVAVMILGTAGLAFAQSPNPEAPIPGSGYGMRGGRGMRGGMMGRGADFISQSGPLHDAMIAAMAEKLGLSVESLNARLANGESMAQVAESQGFAIDQFRTLLAEARSSAIDQAVKDGTLTQEQADWMKQRGGWVLGTGRGMRGSGAGNIDCPYYQAAP